MTPTNELRFVEREIVIKPMTATDPTYTTKVIRVLQQKWVEYKPLSTTVLAHEWRDVPLVKEEV